MFCCFLFFISCEAFWCCLCDATLPDLLYLMPDCFTATTSWYAVWSPPYQVMLHDFVFMMLRLDLLYFMLRCFTFPELVLTMLRCLMLSTSCYAASLSLCHTKLLRVIRVILSSSLKLSSWCYAAWSSLLHAAVPDLPYIMLFCSIFTKLRFSAWSCLHDATLLGFICFMLRCFTLSTSCQTASPPLLQVTLFDLVFLTLRCLTFSTSCYQDRPTSCFSASEQNHVTRLDLVFMMLVCWVFTASF